MSPATTHQPPATLNIAEGLELPLSFVTGTQAILGIKGSGKSHTASVEAEELLEAGQQIVVIDPTGAWWGLRSSKDGEAAGYAVVVMGGHHADLPLPPTAGRHVAAAVFATRTSIVLDLSTMNKTEQAVFIGALLEELYRLMDATKVLHLFADEAHMYAPQGARGEKTRSAGAMEAVVSRGRIKGIGVTMITQRPQKLNKDVLTQADTLCCHRLSHPLDIKAVKEWVDVHASAAASKSLVAGLPNLATGTAWFWTPLVDRFEKVSIRDRRTFDSGRTPVPGVTAVVPKKIADVDVDSLRAAIEAGMKPAEKSEGNLGASDLRSKIRSLEIQLDETQKQLRETQTPGQTVGQLYQAMQEANSALRYASDLNGVLTTLRDRLRDLHAGATATAPRDDTKVRDDAKKKLTTPDSALSVCEQAIVDTLAYYRNGRTRKQIAIEAGYSHTSGSYGAAISRLLKKGMVDSIVAPSGNGLILTDAGRAVAQKTKRRNLLEYWKGKLGKCEAALLQALHDTPHAVERSELAYTTGYSARSGSYGAAISKLLDLALVQTVEGRLLQLNKELR